MAATQATNADEDGNEIKSQVASRLRKLLADRKLSVAKAAQKCGLPKGSFEKYIQGLQSPGLSAIRKICEGCNASADWLIFGHRIAESRQELDDAINAASYTAMHEFLADLMKRLERPEVAEQMLDHLAPNIGLLASRHAQKVVRDTFNRMPTTDAKMGDSAL